LPDGDDASFSMNSQAPRTRANIAMKKNMNIFLISGLQSSHPPVKSSLDLRSAIADHIAVIASKQKDLLVTEVVDKKPGDRVRVEWINSGSRLVRHRRMENEFRVAGWVLVRETWLMDLNRVITGDKVEIVNLGEGGQVAAPC
jgi:hypothetical protein